MRFKPPSKADWFAEYAWVAFPESNMPPNPSAAENQQLNADLSQVGNSSKENRSANNAGAAAAASARPKSNLRSQRGGSAQKSVKFDQEEGPAAADSTASGKKKPQRPRSAVKGKSGKVLPRASGRAGNAAAKQEGAEEATSGRKRGAAAA